MPCENRNQDPAWIEQSHDFDPGGFANIAILVSVIVTFLSASLYQDAAITPVVWAILLSLGVLHLFLYFPANGFFFKSKRWNRVLIYFFLQLLLSGTMHFLGHGRFWLLFLPLTSQAAFVFKRRFMILFCVIVTTLFLLPFQPESFSGIAQSGLIFLSALVFVLIFTELAIRERLISDEKDRIARELEQANLQLKAYTAQAEELARSRERNRLAREIHDSLGHYLTVVSVQIEAARILLESPSGGEKTREILDILAKAHTLTRNGLEDVRRSVAALRSGPLGEKPFLEALQSLIRDTEETGLILQWRVAGEACTLAPQAEATLYRSLQEALTNIRKHAHASRADAFLSFEGGSVRLEVTDNGVGLQAEAGGEGRFGLRGLRERVEFLRGRMEFGPGPEGGCRLSVQLPAL